MKRKRGRPKKRNGETLASTINVRLKPEEKIAMKAKATKNEIRLSEWARLALLAALREKEGI